MHEPPTDLTDDQVLSAVRLHWAPDATEISHLAVGFGAHHWRITGPGADLFVTLDRLGPRHTAASLEGAYAAAADLAAQGLEFVLAGVRSGSGRFTVPVEVGALSAVGWRDGISGKGEYGSHVEAQSWADRLARLHAAEPPSYLPRWRPLVVPSFGDQLARDLAVNWPEPFGETARGALVTRLDDVRRWTSTYHRLAAQSDPATWTVTHGEPHTRNILRTPSGDLLVDWESARLAPRERDFATLVESGFDWLGAYAGAAPEWDLLEMFDLEWRLDEIQQYADWFRRPHSGNASDRVALTGLLDELARPEWRRPT